MKVKIYTTSPCPYCSMAKSLLKNRKIDFEEIFVSYEDDAKWIELEKETGFKTMPQIFINDQFIGGYTELAKLDSQGKLAQK